MDKDWTEILARDPKILQKQILEIFKAMDTSFLERNPIVTRKLAALRMTRPRRN